MNLIRDFANEISSKLLAEHKIEPLGKVVLMGNQVLSPQGEYSRNYGIYPQMSEKMARQIIGTIRGEIKEIFWVNLINDWKLLKGFPYADEIRRTYWANPHFDYKKRMQDSWHPHLLAGKGPGSSQGGDFNRHLFFGRVSEQRLHNDYARFREKGQNAKLIDQALTDNSFECELGDGTCDATKCASEFIMILRHFYQHRIQRVIAFLPSECQGPIEMGARITEELKEIFMPDLNFSMKIDNIYLNSCSPETSEELLSPHLQRNLMVHQIEK